MYGDVYDWRGDGNGEMAVQLFTCRPSLAVDAEVSYGEGWFADVLTEELCSAVVVVRLDRLRYVL